MVITFSDRTAFRQLRDEGAVVTFRAEERSATPRDGIQRTWCHRQRGDPKEFDVTVTHLNEKTPGDDYYDDYLPLSGFDSKSDWLAAILALNGSVPPRGHYYLVTRCGPR